MKKILLYTLISLSFLYACQSSKNEKNNQEQTTAVVKTESLPENFYKRLEGTIGDKAVTVNLQKLADEWDGNYYYDGSWLNLSMDTLIGKDSVVLIENGFADAYFDPDFKSPKLYLKWTGKGFTGKWRSGDQTKAYDIELNERYPEGSYTFSPRQYQDTVKAFAKQAKSPQATFGIEYLEPTGHYPGKSWLNAQLLSMQGIKVAGANRKADYQLLAKDYFDHYKKDIADQVKDGPDRGFMEWMNYSTNSQQSLVYNGNGFVVVDYLTDDYSGGAHGNYNSTMFCFDVVNQKRMTLSDVVDIDSNQLEIILEKNFRKQYNLKPQDQLNKVLFDNYITVNNNFYFNSNGLAFMYNPYEIASYAQGQIVVFIPFSALKGHLVAAFTKRMGL